MKRCLTYRPSITSLNQQGVTLIELMVALVIGLVLIAGTTQLYVKSQRTYQDNEGVAQLQEVARYALNVLEQDIVMSSYFGVHSTQESGSAAISGQANQLTGTAAAAVATSADANACGTNFAVDLANNIQGDNNGLLPASQGGAAGFLSSSRTTACSAYGQRIESSDTLTVRRAETCENTNAAFPNCATKTLRICSAVGSDEDKLVNNSSACPNDGTSSLVNDVLVHAYYIDRDSTQQTTLPSLRRKILVTGPAFQDQEVIPGVEDMQVQFGIETIANESKDLFKGTVSRYVNPDDSALTPTAPAVAQIVTVRIWLLVRAEAKEPGYTDTQTYSYADRLGTAVSNLNSTTARGMMYAPNDGYRRLLVSRTYNVRNINIKGQQ